MPGLNELVEIIKNDLTIFFLTIEGYSDNPGDAIINKDFFRKNSHRCQRLSDPKRCDSKQNKCSRFGS